MSEALLRVTLPKGENRYCLGFLPMPRSVLIVDDERDTNDILARMVVARGFEYKDTLWDEERTVLDRLRLDLDHGLALRRREWSSDGHILSWLTNKDLAEVFPGIWLPKNCELLLTAPPWDPREYRDKPVLARRLKVVEFQVNTVADELFEPPPDVTLEEMLPRRR